MAVSTERMARLRAKTEKAILTQSGQVVTRTTGRNADGATTHSEQLGPAVACLVNETTGGMQETDAQRKERGTVRIKVPVGAAVAVGATLRVGGLDYVIKWRPAPTPTALLQVLGAERGVLA